MKVKGNKIINPTKTVQQIANSVARRFGCGKANHIILGETDDLIDHVPYGFRKFTTGEYVPNAYRRNFGWKNTYYQRAETTVMISRTVLQ